MKVLIVDDNVDAADIFKLLVERLGGHEVVTSYSGESALETLADFRPDVIFLDIVMPKLDGLEVCRRIRRLPWSMHTAIYAVTGRPHVEERSAEAGFTGCILKPFDWIEVEQLLAGDLPTSFNTSISRG